MLRVALGLTVANRKYERQQPYPVQGGDPGKGNPRAENGGVFLKGEHMWFSWPPLLEMSAPDVGKPEMIAHR
jgi:hypothetical protein